MNVGGVEKEEGRVGKSKSKSTAPACLLSNDGPKSSLGLQANVPWTLTWLRQGSPISADSGGPTGEVVSLSLQSAQLHGSASWIS